MTRVEVVPASLAKGRFCARPLKTPKKGQVFHSLALEGCERSGGDAVVHCPISRMEKLSKTGHCGLKTLFKADRRGFSAMDTDGEEFITFEEYVEFLPMNPE